MKTYDVFDAVVAGAGLWGCTMARRLAEAGKKVLVLEKRNDIGGNVRCETEHGIEVHKYGSHIFHTSNEDVWRFVNRFVTFNDYRHRALAKHDGKLYHLPIGRTIVRELLGVDKGPGELDEEDRKKLFDAFIRGYTSKQWGVPAEQVDPSVIARLKVRDSDSIDYFDDPHQGIPVEGYNALFERMLAHPSIRVETGHAFGPRDLDGLVPTYYSGPVDALFGYALGELPWRSLRFETHWFPERQRQETAIVNYPDLDVPFTRIHEYKLYHTEGDVFANADGTILTWEYPEAWRRGMEPYYPVKNEQSDRLFRRYAEMAERCKNLILGGRLGSYRYLDMDQTIADALHVKI